MPWITIKMSPLRTLMREGFDLRIYENRAKPYTLSFSTMSTEQFKDIYCFRPQMLNNNDRTIPPAGARLEAWNGRKQLDETK